MDLDPPAKDKSKNPSKPSLVRELRTQTLMGFFKRLLAPKNHYKTAVKTQNKNKKHSKNAFFKNDIFLARLFC